MPALFRRSADNVLRALAIGVVVSVIALLAFLFAIVRAPACTGEEQQPLQPVQFDHRHHVRDDGIDCLYCHREATRSAHAGVPPTTVCMGCHSQVWPDSPTLAPVRASAANKAPIAWRRVYDLPDFVFFDHHAHVQRGVGCVSCHGRVDLMAEVVQQAPLTMGWCLDCHRDPAPHLRPLSLVTDMEAEIDPQVGAAMMRALAIRPGTYCTTCHR